MNKIIHSNSTEATNCTSDDEEENNQQKKLKIPLPLGINELNANKTLATYYEQILIQRNIELYQKQQLNYQQQQQQQQELHLQIQPNFTLSNTKTNTESTASCSSSSSTSTSSLLSISSSSKSQQVSPADSASLINQKNFPLHMQHNQQQSSDLDSSTAKYRAYMMNMAAAVNFPYSIFGFPPGSAPNLNAHLHHNQQQHHHQQQQQHHHQQQQIAAAAVAAAAAAAVANQNPHHHMYMNQSNSNRNILLENFPNLFAAAAAASSASHSSHHQNNNNSNMNNAPREFNGNQQSAHQDTPHCFNRIVMKQEEPKPAHSYIGLIALAILSTPEKKLVLSDIYQWILDNYTYFHTRGSGWRNSIRHNLSLNDCFMKSGRSANGKGHYWTIHPANLEDFSRGDFRRRRAQRRVRKSLGLTLPEEDEEDEDEEEILTPPSSLSPVPNNSNNSKMFNSNPNNISNNLSSSSSCSSTNSTSVLENNNLSSKSTCLPMKRHLAFDSESEDRKKLFKTNDLVSAAETSSDHFLQPDNSYHQTSITNNYANSFNNSTSSLIEDSSYENDTSNDNQSESSEPEQHQISTNSNTNPTTPSQTTTNLNAIINSNRKLAINNLAADSSNSQKNANKKRSFNVDSLLAPDQNSIINNEENEHDEDAEDNDDNNSNNNNTNNNSKRKHEDEETDDEPEIGEELKKDLDESEETNKTKDNLNKKQDDSNQTNKINKLKSAFHSQRSTNSQSAQQHHHHHHHQSHHSNRHHNASSRSASLYLSSDQHQNSPFSKLESNNVDVEKWKQTFSKIMARSYKNNSNNNSNHNNNHNLLISNSSNHLVNSVSPSNHSKK